MACNPYRWKARNDTHTSRDAKEGRLVSVNVPHTRQNAKATSSGELKLADHTKRPAGAQEVVRLGRFELVTVEKGVMLRTSELITNEDEDGPLPYRQGNVVWRAKAGPLIVVHTTQNAARSTRESGYLLKRGRRTSQEEERTSSTTHNGGQLSERKTTGHPGQELLKMNTNRCKRTQHETERRPPKSTSLRLPRLASQSRPNNHRPVRSTRGGPTRLIRAWYNRKRGPRMFRLEVPEEVPPAQTLAYLARNRTHTFRDAKGGRLGAREVIRLGRPELDFDKLERNEGTDVHTWNGEEFPEFSVVWTRKRKATGHPG
ncbi:hypothetical protein B0H11DRAFT_1922374 [Mycena galericulata]|nr:hypothetical protein B0H11DRAFT_1922374 [Mycena galericulata]